MLSLSITQTEVHELILPEIFMKIRDHYLFALPLAIVLMSTQVSAENSAAGANDFRISQTGGLGTPFVHPVFDPKVAYNSTNRSFLVIWSGTEATKTVVFGRLVDATTGSVVGTTPFTLSAVPGSADNALQGTSGQAVVHNSTRNEYLVVFRGSIRSDSTEIEVFGQRVGADGTAIGSAFRISDMGVDGDPGADVYHDVRVAYNSTDDEYLVVWRGDDVGNQNTPNGHFEVFGQLLAFDQGQLVETGANDFSISNFPAVNGISTARIGWPDVVYNPVDNRYLVVWQIDYKNKGAYVIVRRILDAGANQVGDNGLVISDSLDFAGGGAMKPAVSYNRPDNQYLVVWTSIRTAAGSYEILGQLLDANGDETGANDFSVSSNGSASNPASSPRVTYNTFENNYLVCWQAVLPGGPRETEVFGQFLDAAGTRIGQNDFRISDLGEAGNTRFYTNPGIDVVYADGLNSNLAVWYGDDNSDGQVDDELEVFAEILTNNPVPVELSSFAGVVVGEVAVLTWTTASETNNYGFEIQRASQSGWQTVGFIQGAVTTTEPKHYSYRDDLSAVATDTSKIEYRLKQIDLDGTFAYSSVISLRARGPERFELHRNYPNPFNPSTTIQFDLPQPGQVTLKVYNLRGELVQTLVDAFTVSGYHRVQWDGRTADGNQATSGIYVVRLAVSTSEADFVRARRVTLLK
jgi:hypothetical protein